ncbi:MAG TPA: hypothetical protein DCE80_20525 [Ignavibacteriales bacterium]|nr:hypothetical protein [Ignavibacteriales bacterium]
MRDPFYQQIIERLKGRVDPDLFEACASDILRTDFPTLVPIRGGSDAGMDGAVADGKELPFPLICTTSKDVIGNLTKNLKSYLNNGRTRKKAVFATTQELTPKRRRNLEARAQELGFVLIQIYTQVAFADRLYYNQRWCLELLNLTGEPSPISIVPLTKRPLLGETLIGREGDMVWIKQTKGDRLLVGQPGSGKTFLLHLYAKQNEGLFVIRKDCTAIAPAIRTQNPKTLIVDDAHVDSDFLVKLRQLREQIGASFEIIATCWPNAQNKIAGALNLPISQIHQLELLTLDEVVEVVKSAGIKGPLELIREIVSQAQGRPGLAITLTYLCLQGDIQRVALGDALSESILTTFEPMVGGKKASAVLAAFAIGGDSGMTMKVVANALEQSEMEIRCIVTELASGGVISEIARKNTLSVNPAALRFALVRDIFFKGPQSLSPEQLIETAPDLNGVAITLIGAKARGARIPSDKLLMILEKARSEDAWVGYTWLGKDEANTVIELHPELLIRIARAALHKTPERVIPLLLKGAVGNERALHSSPDHPLRLIGDWIKESYPGSGVVIERKETLLKVIKDVISKGMDERVCFKALPFVFSLRYENHTTDPGLGRTVTYTHGPITLDEIKRIASFWPEVLSIVKKLKNPDWSLVIEVINEIAFPGPFISGTSPDFHKIRKNIVTQMLHDLVSLPGVRIGLSHRIKDISQQLKIKLKIKLDKDFEILFPYREKGDWKIAQECQRKAVLKLAEKWDKVSPDKIVGKIALFEVEAKSVGISCPRWTPILCWEIAQKVKLRLPWINAMIDAGLSGDLIEHFLRQAALKNETGWKMVISECLSNKDLKGVAISILLTIQSPPAYLMKKAIQNLEGFAETIKTLCFRKEIPEETLVQLLHHPDPLIAGNAAIGEWESDPKGKVQDRLKNDWGKALLHLNYDEYFLGEILKHNSELAYKWLKIHIKQKNVPYEMLKIYQSAISSLSLENRKELLMIFPKDSWRSEIINFLVGDSLELYRVLLEDKNKKGFHLLPLSKYKDYSFEHVVWKEEDWIAKAKFALEAGYTPEVVARTVFPFESSWGNESDMWKRSIDRYNGLCSNDDPRIRKVGEINKTEAMKVLERVLAEERREAIYGYT